MIFSNKLVSFYFNEHTLIQIFWPNLIQYHHYFSAFQRRLSNVDLTRRNSNDSGSNLLTTSTSDSRASSRIGSLRRLSTRPEAPVRRYSTAAIKDRYSPHENLEERIRPASETSNVQMIGNYMMNSSGVRNRGDDVGNKNMPRKSFSASDSSLEDFVMDKENHDTDTNGVHLKRRRSRRSKSVVQQNNNVNSSGHETGAFRSSHHPSSGKILLELEDFESDPSLYPLDDRKRRNSNYNPSPGYDGNTLRHIASDAALYSLPDAVRRKSDSQSSEYSDIKISSPPGDSLSPSSPDISRSPRESADSDMLGLRK